MYAPTVGNVFSSYFNHPSFKACSKIYSLEIDGVFFKISQI